MVRSFGPENGLMSPPVWALAQDSAGFLWIGTEGGLFRFDGIEFRHWAADSIREPVHSVTVSPDGRIAALEYPGRVFEITASGARAISPPVTRPLHSNAVAYDRRGVLWLVDGVEVRHLRADNEWQALPPGSLDDEVPRHLKPNRVGAVDVFTDHGVWRIHADSLPRRLVAAPFAQDAVSLEDGRTIVLAEGGILVEVSNGTLRELLAPPAIQPARAIALVERHGTIWASRDQSLVASRPGEPAEEIPFTGPITYGGPLLVDREGSLWLGSNALHQFPEPETWVRSATVFRGTRFLARTGPAIWASTWGQLQYVRRTPDGWTVASGKLSQSAICEDSAGTVWTGHILIVPAGAGPTYILEINDTITSQYPLVPSSTVYSCQPARDGGVWLGTSWDLLHVSAAPRVIRKVPSPPGLQPVRRMVALHDRNDRLWMGMEPDRICSAAVPDLFAGSTNAWSCDTVSVFDLLSDIVEMPSGRLWVGSSRLGLLARRPGAWQPLRMDELPTRTVLALVPSGWGGVWVAGHGILHRMQERSDGATEVVERITQWHGVPGPGAGDVLEEEDGTIWIAYDGGIVRVPAAVRFASLPPPRVALVDASVDGEAISTAARLELPHDRNRVDVRFAALSFRDPTLLRHQVRLAADASWTESRGSPSFRWVDLRAGDYQVEYRASLDGRAWSAEPARFAFTVRPAWYASPWTIAAAFLLVAGLTWGAYRVRLAHLLGLERQRTRIAMDLHDEVGSGLASVGILSGVLAADALDFRERRRAASDIAAAAEELGNALSDIVWSLDPHAATLEELASRLAEHGERLCPDGRTQFSACLPAAWPPGRLDVAVRRNVLLVGLEALHNAVRHAGAAHVVLSMEPKDGWWELSVRDDGTGFAPGAPANGRRGHGLRGMRRRAEEIGAQLSVQSAADGGASVVLRFPLRPSRGARSGVLTERVRRILRRSRA
jgi:signal transduction histidine kinase